MSRITVSTGGRIRQGLLTAAAIASVLTMVQCGGGGDNGGGGTTGPPAGRIYSQFAYASNVTSGTVSMFGIDANGKLVSLGAPLAAGAEPHAITVDPKNRFVYVSNHTSDFLSGYKINATTGVLTPIPGPLTVGAGAHASVFDRNGSFLYVITGEAASTITAYTVDQTTGVLTMIGTSGLLAGTHAHNLTVDPKNTFVYVASMGSNETRTYAIGPTGALAPVGTVPGTTGPGQPAAVAVHPSLGFAYVVNHASDLVQNFIVNPDGTLTLNTIQGPTGTIGADGDQSHSIVIDTTGTFLYVGNINSLSNNISAWSINQTTGELVALTGAPPLFHFTTDGQPHGLTLHPKGGFLYVANSGSDTIQRFAINPTTGELTLSDTFPDPDPAVSDGPTGIVITNF